MYNLRAVFITPLVTSVCSINKLSMNDVNWNNELIKVTVSWRGRIYTMYK